MWRKRFSRQRRRTGLRGKKRESTIEFSAISAADRRPRLIEGTLLPRPIDGGEASPRPQEIAYLPRPLQRWRGRRRRRRRLRRGEMTFEEERERGRAIEFRCPPFESLLLAPLTFLAVFRTKRRLLSSPLASRRRHFPPLITQRRTTMEMNPGTSNGPRRRGEKEAI